MTISVLLKTESHFPVDRKKIKQAVAAVLETKIRHKGEVSITIVGDRCMRELNHRYRNIDETTDVLSFPLHDPSSEHAPFVSAPDGVLRLGDIVVSYPQAIMEAEEDNKFVDDVIVELVLHGLNHLLGIHHQK